jgi:hypothetical protein
MTRVHRKKKHLATIRKIPEASIPSLLKNTTLSLFANVNYQYLNATSSSNNTNSNSNSNETISETLDIHLKLLEIGSGASDNITAIKHVTYHITILKESNKKNNLLIDDFFHSHSGNLILRILPSSPLDNITIKGYREPFQDSWIAPNGDIININDSSLLLENGTRYHVHVEIFSMYDDRLILPQEQMPNFDFQWSATNDNSVVKSNHLQIIQSSVSPPLITVPEFPSSLSSSLILGLSVLGMITLVLLVRYDSLHL